jgi:hypothetical protein
MEPLPARLLMTLTRASKGLSRSRQEPMSDASEMQKIEHLFFPKPSGFLTAAGPGRVSGQALEARRRAGSAMRSDGSSAGTLSHLS